LKRVRARLTAVALATAALLGGVGAVGAGQADAVTKGSQAAWSPTHCLTNVGRVACVDLTRQKMWIQDGSKIIFGPVPVRTGRRGFVTRDGLFHVYDRERMHWSTLYHVWMPYSQFFSGGEALHAVYIPISTPPGSHGCVNMTMHDAATAWNLLKLGSPVDVFGRKPGT
jgi:hypothetical protein